MATLSQIAVYRLGTSSKAFDQRFYMLTLYSFFRFSIEKPGDTESSAINWSELAKAMQQPAGEFFFFFNMQTTPLS